jgi:hypothetical protein
MALAHLLLLLCIQAHQLGCEPGALGQQPLLLQPAAELPYAVGVLRVACALAGNSAWGEALSRLQSRCTTLGAICKVKHAQRGVLSC